MLATLVGRSWLHRMVEVEMPDGPHLVEYNSRGAGFEQVTVDGRTIRRRSSLWYVPRFEFELGGHPSVVDIRVWPWLTLRSFVLRVNEKVIYAEGVDGGGKEPKEPLGDLADFA